LVKLRTQLKKARILVARGLVERLGPFDDPTPTGRAILTLAGLLPAENYTLRVKIAGEKPRKVALDEKVDLRRHGV
jgi:hypothetical protein